jgi:hypothetical protein
MPYLCGMLLSRSVVQWVGVNCVVDLVWLVREICIPKRRFPTINDIATEANMSLELYRKLANLC